MNHEFQEYRQALLISCEQNAVVMKALQQNTTRLFFLTLVLVSPSGGNELVGTWEKVIGETEVGSARVQFVFEADSTFQTHQFLDKINNDHYQFRSKRDDNSFLPALNTLSVHGTGVYAVDEEQGKLVVIINDSYMMFDGETFEEYFTKIGRKIARFLADEYEVPEEEYDAFELEAVEVYLDLVDIESYYRIFRYAVNEDTYPMQEMDIHVPDPGHTLFAGNNYALDGEALIVGHGEYRRIEDVVEVPTMVITTSSWGMIKQSMR